MATFLPLSTYEEFPPAEMQRRAEQFRAELTRRRTVRQFSDRAVPRELIETSLQQVTAHKRRVAGIVFNFVNHDRAKKYGGEYFYGKSYEKYYSE